MGIIPFRRRKVESDDDAGESYTIPTHGGVERHDQPAGEITVSRGDGDTIIELLVDDGEGGNTTVFLNADQAAWLAFAVGAVAVDL